MHEQVQVSAGVPMVGLMIVAAVMALAIFVFVKLVERFGVLKTLAWCIGMFFLGSVGLTWMYFLRAQNLVVEHLVVEHEAAKSAAATAADYARNEARGVSLRNSPGFHSEQERELGVLFASGEPEQATASAWDEAVAPVANVYPGIPDCGRPLAAKLVTHLQDELKSEEESSKAEAEAPPRYRIALKNSGLDQRDFLNFLIHFRNEFTAAFPGSFVDDMTAGSYPTPKDADKENQLQRLSITVYHSSDGQGGMAKWDDRNPRRALERSGQMVCKLRRNGRMGQMEFTSDFIEKAWVADAEKFLMRWPKRKFIIGFSPRLAASEHEARAEALKDANVRLARLNGEIFLPSYDMEENVVDRFVQKLTMPYGSVWREAVLLDYKMHDPPLIKFEDPAFAARVAADGSDSAISYSRTSSHAGATDVASGPGRSQFHSERLVAGLMLLTVVVGWISNWMTQGYYRGPVWTVAGTLFSIGFLFLIFVVLISFA